MTEFYEGRELESLASTRRYHAWIASEFADYVQGRVMELGAGIGTLAPYWLSRASELHLVEPARNLYELLEQRFRGHDRVSLYCGTLEDTLAGAGRSRPGTFDAAVMVNVLEHIEDDARTLRTIFDLLKPGGHLLVFVPAMPALYGSLDRVFGHHRRYRRAQLEEVVADSGFEVRRCRYFDFLGVLPWFIAGRIVRTRTIGRAAAQLYDRLAVPVGRVVERLVQPPVGKNLLIIARRKEGE